MQYLSLSRSDVTVIHAPTYQYHNSVVSITSILMCSLDDYAKQVQGLFDQWDVL